MATFQREVGADEGPAVLAPGVRPSRRGTRRDRRPAQRAGPRRRGRGHRGLRAGRHRGGPGARPACPSRCRAHPAGGRGRRRRGGPAGLLRGVQHVGWRPGAVRHPGYDHAERDGDRPSQAARRVVQRDALFATGDRPGLRPGRHPGAGRRPHRRPGPDRGPRVASRRSLRPGGQPEPSGRHVGGRCGAGPGCPAGRAVHPTRPVTDRGRRRRHRSDGGRDPGPRPLRQVRGARAGRHLYRPVAAVDGQPPDGAGHAPHQQRGRRLQLRDAGAWPAQPHLRPGHRGRWWATGSPGHFRRGHRDPGRGGPDVDGRRWRGGRRYRRAGEHRRDHGWGVHGDRRVDLQRGPRDGLVGSDDHRLVVASAQPAERGIGPFRAGGRSGGGRPGHAPLRRAAGRDRRHLGTRRR